MPILALSPSPASPKFTSSEPLVFHGARRPQQEALL